MFAQTIRTLFEVGTAGMLTDGQLLERFSSRPDESAEAAFAALVARHGPMVLCVCRGVLGDAHDAEDAFQATFLVLAKRAGSIRDPDLLGNWLYGVARRSAQKAKARRARCMCRNEGDATMSSIAGDTVLAELRPIQGEESAALHEEVDRLPHRLRVPIVLCYLEGLTHAEAARRPAVADRHGPQPDGSGARPPQKPAHAPWPGLRRHRDRERNLARCHGGSAAGPGSSDHAVRDRGRRRRCDGVRLDARCNACDRRAQGHVHEPAQTNRGHAACRRLPGRRCGDDRSNRVACPAFKHAT